MVAGDSAPMDPWSTSQAFPGVLLGTGAIAVLVRYTFPYGWTWTESLLLGAILAATDPVATVAVLGDVSASAVTQQGGRCPWQLSALPGTGLQKHALPTHRLRTPQPSCFTCAPIFIVPFCAVWGLGSAPNPD